MPRQPHHPLAHPEPRATPARSIYSIQLRTAMNRQALAPPKQSEGFALRSPHA